MVDFKEKVAQMIGECTGTDIEELKTYIEIPPDRTMGDYAFPCFKLARTLKKAPPMIANDIKSNIKLDEEYIEKVEILGGYLNFFINKKTLVLNVLNEVEAQKNEYGKSNIGKGKNIVIDYSSPNIAKTFHIGHLRTTVIGGALYNIYKYLGYNVIGINHLGDYGTQFGKLIEAYKLWGNEYDLTKDSVQKLTELYVRISNLCKEDEDVLERCRENFKKLEDGDEYCTNIWKEFKDLSLKEFQRVYDLLGSKFDSWNGESFYVDKMPEVIERLKASGRLEESEGAQIVNLESEGISTPIIIKKSNGSSTYATRDLAAILYRARTYDFDKALYVTSYEQILHFKQIFATAKLLGLDEKYINGLEHIPYGMVLLSTGKMSTREGNVVGLEDLLNEAIARAKKIIEEKNPNLEDKDEVAKRVGLGAVIFNDLANSRIKDEIFDWDTILNFQGETGPYIQYIYVRTKSILDGIDKLPKIEDIKLENLIDEEAVKVLELIYKFEENIINSANKNEPSILSRYLIDLAKAYSSYYNANKILDENKEKRDARVYLTYAVGNTLKIGAELLGIKMPNKM